MPPTDPDLRHLETLMRQDRMPEAIDAARALIRRHPREALLHNALGVALGRTGRHDEALRAFQRALELAPGYGEANDNLISTLIAAGRPAEAEAPIRLALARNPLDAPMHRNLAALLLARGEAAAALDSIRRAETLAPGQRATHLTEASILRHLGQTAAAGARLAALVAAAPDDPEARLALAELRATEGRLDEARAGFLAVLDRDPRQGSAWEGLASLHRFAPGDPLIDRMQALYDDAATPAEARLHLGFALAKAMDDLGQPEHAMAFAGPANRYRQGQHARYDHARRRKHLQRIRGLLAPAIVQRLCEQPRGPGPVPIFVIGMPRSGTTLVEQILARHPDVAGAGELPHLGRLGASLLANPRLIEVPGLADWARQHRGFLAGLAGGAGHVVDKMPANADWIVLIRALFPDTRIVRMLRDPRDVALSVFLTNFAENDLAWTTDLEDIASYAALLDDHLAQLEPLMEGAMLTLVYEDLVRDPESQIRRLAAHCGLAFHPAMLVPEQGDGVVTSASLAQVRRAISAASVGRWQRYEAGLAPFVSALARLRPKG